MAETPDTEQELKYLGKEPPRLTQEYVASLRRLKPRQAFHIKNIVEHKVGDEVESAYQEFDYEPLEGEACIEILKQGPRAPRPIR